MTKSDKKCDNYKSIIAVCCLVSIVTAVIVSLVFAVVFNATIAKSGNGASSAYAGLYSNETANPTYDENTLSILSAGAVADFFEQGKTGFIYASADDCADCSVFATRLASAASSVELRPIYHLNFSAASADASDVESYTKSLTGGDTAYPTLIYVKNGKVYDRLDDTNSESLIASFLAKYR